MDIVSNMAQIYNERSMLDHQPLDWELIQRLKIHSGHLSE